MKKLLFTLSAILFIYFSNNITAQKYNPLLPPNTYRNADNPNYWKNKLPFCGYWQQDVHYKIKARIDEKKDIISASEELTYWNNSPDTLTFVFFHLYQNAFQPESYYDKLQRANKINPVYGQYESQKKGTEINYLKVNGKNVKIEIDNTIMKVYLPEPLLPNQSITFTMDFKTYFDKGSVRRRMKVFDAWGYKHYDGVHWYPRISVYDRKFGWTTDQHLGREFYGDFGTFDVELTFASNYIVGATGFLVNRKEVLPDDLRKKLDIKNFAHKPWNSKPSVIIPYDSTKTKTWIYHAENVHDFAFTADPTYRIGEAHWEDKVVYALAQEPHASHWQNAAEYTAKVLKVYSEDFGRYVYHKMIVADARDGMEYPMLTLDGGMDPSYRGLLAHEVGHNWFFGQVGNNETYRAMLDEGFTQFLTAWALTKIDGDTLIEPLPKSKYVQKFKKPVSPRLYRAYFGYLMDAITEDDAFLNTHSDDFNGAIRHGGGYRHVYYKTATMLYNMRYVLGEELFLKSMQNYFNTWKIAHPYVEDFRNTIIQYSHVDLNWFFDQWLTTTKNIDYKIKSVKPAKQKGKYIIEIERLGEMQMPVEFTIISKNKKQYNYYIPNNWFTKKTTAKTLPKWIGWGKLNPVYKVEVEVPEGIKDVIIDPSMEMADVNRLNNSKKFPLSVQFDSKIWNYPDWGKYELFVRPDFWYNSYDGLKIGIHMNGNYMQKLHNLHASVWMNTGLLQNADIADKNLFDPISFNVQYNTSTHKLMKHSWITLHTKWLDGLNSYRIRFSKQDRKQKNTFYTEYKSMIRIDSTDLHYLLYPNDWKINQLNNTITLGVLHTYKYVKGRGEIDLSLRSSTLFSDYNYAQLTLEAKNYNQITKKLDFNTRVFALIGTGNNTPYESALYLAGANPEQLMENKFTRSAGIIPSDMAGFNNATGNFQMGGGLNLRGYNNYVAVESLPDTIVFSYRGKSGVSISGELEFDKLIKFKPKRLKAFKIDTYIFGDAGYLDFGQKTYNISDVRVDAGLGAALTIRKWGPLQTVNPLTIRFDFPVFLNRPPASEEFFQFRWLIGINRTF
jgi:aminopeptidase N